MTALIDALLANRKTAAAVCYGLLALMALASLLVDSSHAHSWAEQHIPFFWSFFGFGAAAAIIGIARWFGGSGIQARPDFYERAAGSEEEQ